MNELHDYVLRAAAIGLSSVCIGQLLFWRILFADWRTIKWRFMLVYVGYMLVHYGVIYFACTRGVSVYAVILGATNLLWIYNTREDWLRGEIPTYMRSSPGELGPPETGIFR